MEVKTNFSARLEGEKVVVVQEITRIMGPEESIKELQGLQAQVKKAESDRDQLTKLINEKKIEKDLENIGKNLDELLPFQKQWEDVNKPLYEDLKVKIKRDVRQEKLKRGYYRVEDINQRIVMQNHILGPICEERSIAMGHPVIHEIKKEFDQI